MNRTYVALLACALLATPGRAWGPTVSMADVARRDQLWADAIALAPLYRAQLGLDASRLTDSLAYDIVRLADANGVTRQLGFRLVLVESRFKVTAVSPKGAVGLTQVMPRTGRDVCGLTRAQLYEQVLNLDCGFRYLRTLLDRYDNEWFALTGYYRGPARADQIKQLGLGYAESILGN